MSKYEYNEPNRLTKEQELIAKIESLMLVSELDHFHARDKVELMPSVAFARNASKSYLRIEKVRPHDDEDETVYILTNVKRPRMFSPEGTELKPIIMRTKDDALYSPVGDFKPTRPFFESDYNIVEDERIDRLMDVLDQHDMISYEMTKLEQFYDFIGDMGKYIVDQCAKRSSNARVFKAQQD